MRKVSYKTVLQTGLACLLVISLVFNAVLLLRQPCPPIRRFRFDIRAIDAHGNASDWTLITRFHVEIWSGWEDYAKLLEAGWSDQYGYRAGSYFTDLTYAAGMPLRLIAAAEGFIDEERTITIPWYVGILGDQFELIYTVCFSNTTTGGEL